MSRQLLKVASALLWATLLPLVRVAPVAGAVVQIAEVCPAPAVPGITFENALRELAPYVDSVPESFGTVGVDSGGRLYVGFVDHLELHAERIASLVSSFESVVICRVPLSAKQMRETRAVLAKKVAGRAVILQASDTSIDVVLNAEERSFADELLMLFPRIIRVQLGWFSYPDTTVPPILPLPELCGNRVKRVRGKGIVWSIDSAALRARSDATFTGSLKIRNQTREVLEIDVAPRLSAVFFDPQGDRVVGYSPQESTLEFVALHLKQNSSAVLSYVYSPASCRGSDGGRLRPGEYRVRFFVGVNEWSPAYPIVVH